MLCLKILYVLWALDFAFGIVAFGGGVAAEACGIECGSDVFLAGVVALVIALATAFCFMLVELGVTFFR